MVVEEHPTLLNVTLYPAKVGGRNRDDMTLYQKPWHPPWLVSIHKPPQSAPGMEHNEEGAGERGDRPYHIYTGASTHSLTTATFITCALPITIVSWPALTNHLSLPI